MEGRSVQNYILMLSSSAYKASQTWSISVITTVVSFSSSVIGRSSVSQASLYLCIRFFVIIFTLQYELQLFDHLIFLNPKSAKVKGNLDAGKQGKEILSKCLNQFEGNSFLHFKSGLHCKWPLSYGVKVRSTIPQSCNQHKLCWETITGLNI